MDGITSLLRRELTEHGAALDVVWERSKRAQMLAARLRSGPEAGVEEQKGMNWKQFTGSASADARRAIRPAFLDYIKLIRVVLGEEDATPASTAVAARLVFKAFNARGVNDARRRDAIKRYVGRLDDTQFEAVKRLAKDLRKWAKTHNPDAVARRSGATAAEKKRKASKGSKTEFGSEFKFTPPTPCDLKTRFGAPAPRERGAPSSSSPASLPPAAPSPSLPVPQPRPADGKDSGSRAAGIEPEYDFEWLVRRCERFATFTESGEPLITEVELATQCLNVLKARAGADAIQGQLVSLFGFEALDFVAELLKFRPQINARAVPGRRRRPTPQPASEGGPGAGNLGDPAPLHSFGSTITIQTSGERQRAKAARKAEKRLRKALGSAAGPSRRALALERQQEKTRKSNEEFHARMMDPQASFVGGVALPKGSKQTSVKGVTEVYVPPQLQDPTRKINLVEIKTLPKYAQIAFKGIESLNQVQSRCFETAFKSNENMLVCAPTGAGKTNVALLTVLHEVGQHLHDGVLQKDAFKIVFVAPMKALAQEVVRKFSRRLNPLGVEVRELTGDMQLTRREIDQTQILVTTPEKWDVITRKAGEANLMDQVRLLLFDEVHLLHEDRGPVIEILVARTLRKVEASQEMCRIVGISATLPNYADVAIFLRVNPLTGLFYFGNEFRPVPLHQTYIGISERNPLRRRLRMNEIAYDKMVDSLGRGHQVMIFVHSRKQTHQLATELLERMEEKQTVHLVDPDSTVPGYRDLKAKVNRSKNSTLQRLFKAGLGFHHAGMVRSDRSISETAFARGFVKVLCCTATLAWGVNLPAHTVIIKGTQLYIPEKGGFCELGMLDVMQIFGRAGRPQYDKTGEAIMITEYRNLSGYLRMLNHALPIESQFIKALPDHLNAEIILGTVSNLREATEWIGYTYLFIRMLRNPMAYGITYEERQLDEMLFAPRRRLIKNAARELVDCRMVSFDEKSGNFFSTDLGRIASHFYIHHKSVEVYNQMLKPFLKDEDLLVVLAHSREFSNIKIRDSEIKDIEVLAKRACPKKITGGLNDDKAKVNVLLQAHISNCPVTSPTLGSDSYYIQQSAGRICRALFQMVLKRGLAYLSNRLLAFCKMIEQRMWDDQHPLRQFHVNAVLIDKLERKRITLDRMAEMETRELGSAVRNERAAPMLMKYFGYIPYFSAQVALQPITRTVLRVSLTMQPQFQWANRFHGTAERFWVWMEDYENDVIYHSEMFVLTRKAHTEEVKISFTIPVSEPLPSSYYVKIISDRWIGSEVTVSVSFKGLILPQQYPPDTKLLRVEPLPVTALFDQKAQSLYRFSHFNPIQTQMFHTGYHSDRNMLIGAPTGSGKTICAEICMHRLFRAHPGKKVIYIAPLKALARERLQAWSRPTSFRGIGRTTIEMTGDATPDARSLKRADILVTTPEKWDGVSRSWQQRGYVRQVGLVIIDEIHMLGQDRGPVLEVIVSRMRYISAQTKAAVRIVGLSTALSNASDLADWLGVEGPGLFNFPPRVRPIPLTVHISGFPGKHYCPRMAMMNKPTYAAIRTYSPGKPVLVFVSSRRQTRLTAIDLVAFCAADGDPHKWVNMAEQELDTAVAAVKDPNLKHMLAFGIGLHHAGMLSSDRKVVENLFLERKIQVLVATSTLAWGVNFPAHLVVVKGTEYFDPKTHRYVDMPITDVLQMMGRAGRPQFDNSGTAVVLVQDSKKNFYHKFLHSPFPVESSLLDCLHNYINAEVVGGAIKSLQDAVDYVTWTFLFRRLLVNPSYYGLEDVKPETVNAFLVQLLTEIIADLEESGCLEQHQDAKDGEPEIEPLTLGYIASYYYLDHRTVAMFADSLRDNSQLDDLLTVLADTAEYDELPVRHNEDKINQELAEKIKWPVREDFEDPHVKANILFQCHFARLRLPMSDFVTDTRSLLDQAIRILQAMVDVAAENGWLQTTLNVMYLTQLVVQGRWDSDDPLRALPGMRDPVVQACRRAGIQNIMDLAAADPRTLARVFERAKTRPGDAKRLAGVIKRLPVMEVKYKLPGPGGSPEARATPDTHLPIMVRLNRSRPRRGNVVKDNIGKPKEEGWWLVVGREDDDELVALKRVSCHSETTVKLEFIAPERQGEYAHQIYLISDSYRGLDRTREFDVYVGSEAAGTDSGASDEDEEVLDV